MNKVDDIEFSRIYLDRIEKVRSVLQRNKLDLVRRQDGGGVDIFHLGNERYYKIHFMYRSATCIEVYDLVDIYAGSRSESSSFAQNDQIAQRLEQKLAYLNLIVH